MKNHQSSNPLNGLTLEGIIEEKKELDGHINRLSNFIQSELYMNLDLLERKRLIRQLEIMHSYSNVLNERINIFSVEV